MTTPLDVKDKPFRAACPKCKKELTYYMSDVRPIRRTTP
jgi:hypothetical protein